ncbi:MAG TPA: hypothetical protein VHF01_17905 [Candidatus Acidoferrum sp.]|nr:hypothetical protein [Candidatus Acidoferrum sp.]
MFRIAGEAVSPPTDEAAPCLPTRLTSESLFEKQPRLIRLPFWNPATQRLNKISAFIESQRHRARRIARFSVSHLTAQRRPLTFQITLALRRAKLRAIVTPSTPLAGEAKVSLPLAFRHKRNIMPGSIRH